MIRKLIIGSSLAVACGFVIGCGGSSSAPMAKPTGDAKVPVIDSVKDMTGGAVAKGKEEILKALGVGEEMTKTVEAKIAGLTGDAKTTAQGKWDALKKMLEEFKTSDKLEGWKDKLTEAVAAVKKAVGL